MYLNLRKLKWPHLVLVGIALISRGCEKGSESKTDNPEHATTQKDEHKDEVKLSPEAITKYGIKVERATQHVLSPTVVAPARLSFNTDAMAHVGAVLRGRVADLKVKKGDSVKKGQKLLVVESPELGEAQSEYLQKITTRTVAGPSVDLSKSAYERAKALYEGSKGITLTELQKREADYKAAQGALQAAESSFTAAENKLHLLGMSQEAVNSLTKTKEIVPRYPITSPIDGQVIEREVTLGELVNPDKEALLVIADVRTLWVLADVPEARLKEIRVDSHARVKVSAAGTDVVQGKVSLIDPSLDPNTRSARVRIEVANDSGVLRPGMFAQAEIFAAAIDGHQNPVLAIPEEAVQTVEGSLAVFIPVKGEENTFAKRTVALGKPVGGLLPVLSGLKAGDEFVAASSFILKAELGKSAAGGD